MIKLEVTKIIPRYPSGITQILDFDYHTRERAAIGRICRCKNCACCKTLDEVNELTPKLLKQFI